MSSFYYFSIANAAMVYINKEKSVSVVVIQTAEKLNRTTTIIGVYGNHISPVSYYWLIKLLLLPSWLTMSFFILFFFASDVVADTVQ